MLAPNARRNIMESYIVNKNCFDEFPNILPDSINAVIVDLPYGQTACEWDIKIDLKQMWTELKRICKQNCTYMFFTTTKFGIELINSNPSWFRYDLVWEKSRKLGFLGANKSPLRSHEMIYIFMCNNGDDKTNTKNLELRKYASEVKTFIHKPLTEINRMLSTQALSHFYSFKSTQFSLPTAETYQRLIEEYKIDTMPGFLTYDDIKTRWVKPKQTPTYNAQKVPGKKYKSNGGERVKGIYGALTKSTIDNKGDRFPGSVLKFDSELKTIHPTQKPTLLLEWLIKSYTNPEDIVLDFTMGSGTTVVACINTDRKYIGIEMNATIYESAKVRIAGLT